MTGSIADATEPVAWVREKDGRRVFYTSLGHPDDFKEASFIRLLVNGLAWASKTEFKK
jgi:type 1 glutamine amidotransferase